MSKGLEYFKKVYHQVPNWVQVMHDYSPAMLDAYTAIRGEAFKSSVLSAVEKDELIASLNAGRLYKRSMQLHTQAGFNKGSKLEHLIEYFLVAAVYKQKEALALSLHAVADYLRAKNNVNVQPKDEYASIQEIVDELISWTKDYDQSFLKHVKTAITETSDLDEIRNVLMSKGLVSEARKHLCLVGMYITELKGSEAKNAVDVARLCGVTDAEFADLGYIIIMTAGIPAWFEISDYLMPISTQ